MVPYGGEERDSETRRYQENLKRFAGDKGHTPPLVPEGGEKAFTVSRLSSRQLLLTRADQLERRAVQLRALAAALPSNLLDLSPAADAALFDLVATSQRD